MVRRTDQVEQTRTRIMDAARSVIVAAGYHAASVEQIAAAAEVTRVTVYRQFGDKRGLLDALADALAARSGVIEATRAASLEPDAVAAVTAFVHGIGRLWAADPDLMRRLVALAAVDPDTAAVVRSREDWRRARVREFAARLTDERRLQPQFSQATASAALEAITAFPTYDTLARGSGIRHDQASTLVLSLLGSIVRLPRPR